MKWLKGETQRKLFAYMWFHPNATLKDAANDLNMSYAYARAVWTRLKKRKDFDRLCPVCFTPSRVGMVCTHCGADFTEPLPFFSYDAHAPVFALMPNGGLGTELVPHLRFANARGAVLGHATEPNKKTLEYARQKLAKMLPNDEKIINLAGLMLEKEFKLFPSLYPGLNVTPKIADAIVKSIYNRLKRAGLLKN